MTKYVHRYQEEVKNKKSDVASDPKDLNGRQSLMASTAVQQEESSAPRRAKSLRIISPDLYHYMIGELNKRHNIHQHDVQLTAVEEHDGLSIIIRFGDDYAHAREMFFTHDMIQDRHPNLQVFIQDMADECKEVLIADYFRMVKP